MADAEVQYQAHEFMDAATQPKSIWISPNEVYMTHALLSKHLDGLVCNATFPPCFTINQTHAQAPERDDTLRIILTELDGVPHLDLASSAELHDARDANIELRLTNRFAHVQGWETIVPLL